MKPNPAADNSRRSLLLRYVIPSGMGVLAFFVLFETYYLSWYVENRILHFILTDVVGAIYGFYLLFHVLILYPIFYFRGAALHERILGTFVVTSCWLIKEVLRMTEFYSIAESVFYLLMPVQIGIILLAIGFMAACEMICRKIEKKKKALDIRVVTPVPVAFVLLAISGSAFILRGGGLNYFFNFYDLYKIVFL